MGISPRGSTSTGDDAGVKKAFQVIEGFGAVLVVLGCMSLGMGLAAFLGQALPYVAGLVLWFVGMLGGFGVGRALVRRYYGIS